MRIRLQTENRVITAALIDNETTQDFISLLPLTLTMNDLFRREKFAHLARAISEHGKLTHTYEVAESLQCYSAVCTGLVPSCWEARVSRQFCF
jgi:hypothetical protein